MWCTKKLTVGLAAGALLAATACAGGGSTAQEVSTQGGEVISEQTPAPATTAFTTVTTAPAAAGDALEAGTAEAIDLLARSLEASNGRPVRGHTSMDAMGMTGFGAASLSFEVDGDADVSTTLSIGEMIEGATGVDADGFGVEIRIVGGSVYVTYTVPEELRSLLGGQVPEGWFTVDAASADSLSTLCASPVPGGILQRGFCQAPNDNTFLLDYVTTAGIAGREDLDGVPTTVVDFAVDFVDMTESFMAEAEAMHGEDGLGGDGLDDDIFGADDLFGADDEYPLLAMTAWIDDSDLVRRLSVDFGSLFGFGAMADAFGEDAEDLPGDMPEDMPGFVQVIDFYDYDADISIEAPPADQIVGDLSDLGDDSPLGFLEG